MTALLKFSGLNYVLDLKNNISNEVRHIFQTLNLSVNQLSFTCRGKPLNVEIGQDAFQSICKDDCIHVIIPLRGGKGGFGAKLKNQGGKKIKPNDNMFSRDMHGRKISYQAAQKQYTQFCKKKKQQDQMVNRERQKFKTMETTIKEGQSFMKLDKMYHQQMQETQKKLLQSIQIGKQRNMQRMRLQKESYAAGQKREIADYNDQCQKLQEIKQESKKQEDQIQKLGEPVKKIKVQQPSIILNPISQFVQKPVPIVSARDKLKSLFKK